MPRSRVGCQHWRIGDERACASAGLARKAHGTGEHSFDGSGFKGVNLFCDAGHDRQFVAALIFDETTGPEFRGTGSARAWRGLTALGTRSGSFGAWSASG